MLRLLGGLLCGVAMAGGAPVRQDQGYDVETDAALKMPVHLGVKFGPIGDVLKSLSKQTGADIECTSGLAETKVTIFVDKIPCNILLDKIGSVLNYHWTNHSGIRRLVTNNADERELSDYIAAEDVVLRAKAEADLASILKQSTPAEDADTSQGGSPLPVRGIPTRAGNQAALSDQVAKVFVDADPSAMDDFWHGMVADVQSGVGVRPRAGGGGGGRRRRGGYNQQSADGQGQAPPSPVSATVIYARYDYYGTHTLQIGSSKFPVVPQRFDIPAVIQPEGDLATTKFGKKVLAWPNMELDKSEEDAFGQHIEDASDVHVGFNVKPPTLQGGQTGFEDLRTQSDLLEKFSKASGIPIVADGFRTSLPMTDPDPTGHTPMEWLQSLVEHTGCAIQIKDGIATVRQGGFWRLREVDIPESQIRTLEARGANATIADYAKFFGGLTAAQAESFESTTPPKVTFDVFQIADVVPALQLLGQLGGNFPTDGTRVPVSELGDSTAAISAAISGSVFLGKAWRDLEPGQTAKREVLLSVNAAPVSRPEGLVSGVSVQIVLPIGQIVEYQIPIKL